VARRVAHVTDALGLERRLLLGVHVRVFDPRHDWPVVAPQEYHDDQSRAKTFDDVASLDLFAEVGQRRVACPLFSLTT
jgi:hypothetical protein